MEGPPLAACALCMHGKLMRQPTVHARRLQSAERNLLKDQLVNVVANALYYSPALALQALQAQGRTQAFFATWFQARMSPAHGNAFDGFLHPCGCVVAALAHAARMWAPRQTDASLLGRMQVQSDFCFYSTSALLLYEGEAAGAEGTSASVRLVDFAHTFTGCGRQDTNCLHGILALMHALSSVVTA